jgi:hypothetical protein
MAAKMHFAQTLIHVPAMLALQKNTLIPLGLNVCQSVLEIVLMDFV